MTDATYIFGAFGIVWAVVFGYVLLLLNRERRLRREIESIKKTMETKEQ